MATLPNALPKLAADPTGRALGLDLPPGRLIGTLLWHADTAAAPGDWAAFGKARAAGLLPLLIDVGGSQGGPERWELVPDETSYPGDHDPEEVLAEYWEDQADDDWPGLAPEPEPAVPDPDAVATDLAEHLLTDGTWLKEPRLALVPARRSADIAAAIGWSGPVNHEDDVARLCAVLRSWEDRFGIRVVALTFDQLIVSVAAPPTTPDAARAVAAEHYAFCPDHVDRSGFPASDAYAEQLIDREFWSFWWD
ncbi:DUF4253 domain-containing protein [Streptomyces sp. NPDC059861]|uniref:DUF4253 domain-containing protein n=1 Tax=Streptomyces sp. NPDC059861 TaxID=3346974 RepID=UPI00365D1DA9